jgi:hypothetical protein
MILERHCCYSTYGIEVFADLADNGLLGCSRVVGEKNTKMESFQWSLVNVLQYNACHLLLSGSTTHSAELSYTKVQDVVMNSTAATGQPT